MSLSLTTEISLLRYVRFPYNVTDPAFRNPALNGSGYAWSEQPDGGSCREMGLFHPNIQRLIRDSMSS